ncbi:hypothetical protein Xkoz_00084 [Xenorhabdus kozodoii]|uniref:Uncharacterized protein n=1 Tax=Xenorhabdus kozodoii TaxID=351676 RepID=A0A2D0LHF1_9GAMM|nr:hypothetical protein Xkoz_00084 [Xenorhabdus kozodoii]
MYQYRNSDLSITNEITFKGYIPIQLQVAVCKTMRVLISPRYAGRYKTHLERRLV